MSIFILFPTYSCLPLALYCHTLFPSKFYVIFHSVPDVLHVCYLILLIYIVIKMLRQIAKLQC